MCMRFWYVYMRLYNTCVTLCMGVRCIYMHLWCTHISFRYIYMRFWCICMCILCISMRVWCIYTSYSLWSLPQAFLAGKKVGPRLLDMSKLRNHSLFHSVLCLLCVRTRPPSTSASRKQWFRNGGSDKSNIYYCRNQYISTVATKNKRLLIGGCCECQPLPFLLLCNFHELQPLLL